MQLSKEAITSYQKLYQKKRGVELDFEKASVLSLHDLTTFALVFGDIPPGEKPRGVDLVAKTTKNDSKMTMDSINQ